jgi:Cd2+/Zn2+-exporting ATPase
MSHPHNHSHDHHEHEHEHEHEHDHGHCQAGSASSDPVALAPVAEGARLERFRIQQMDCPTEQTLIQDALARLAGVQQLQFNLLNRVLSVTHALPSSAPIVNAIAALGMTAEPIDDAAPATQALVSRTPWWPLAVSGVTALAAEVLHWSGSVPQAVIAVVALVSIAVGGLGTYRKGWIALRRLNFNINALMSIAVTGALLIGQWPEAAMVMFLFNVAELIEARSLSRARDAIGGLMQLTPDLASRVSIRRLSPEKACLSTRPGVILSSLARSTSRVSCRYE